MPASGSAAGESLGEELLVFQHESLELAVLGGCSVQRFNVELPETLDIDRAAIDVVLVVVLRIVLVYHFLLLKVKVPVERQRVSRAKHEKTNIKRGFENTHFTMSSTPKSFLHCSAASNISLVLTKSNFRARRNLDY